MIRVWHLPVSSSPSAFWVKLSCKPNVRAMNSSNLTSGDFVSVSVCQSVSVSVCVCVCVCKWYDAGQHGASWRTWRTAAIRGLAVSWTQPQLQHSPVCDVSAHVHFAVHVKHSVDTNTQSVRGTAPRKPRSSPRTSSDCARLLTHVIS